MLNKQPHLLQNVLKKLDSITTSVYNTMLKYITHLLHENFYSDDKIDLILKNNDIAIHECAREMISWYKASVYFNGNKPDVDFILQFIEFDYGIQKVFCPYFTKIE